MNATQNRNYWCDVLRFQYDFGERQGILDVPEDHAPDARACIDLCLSVDRRVIWIGIRAGNALETVYRRENPSSDKWVTLDYRGFRNAPASPGSSPMITDLLRGNVVELKRPKHH